MHMEKFTKNAMSNVLDHNGRSDSKRKPNRSNESIDPSRSHLNYNLAADTQPLPPMTFCKNRLNEINIHGNANVYMIGWVVTVPKTLPENEHKLFFKSCYDFFEKTYGKENVISAYLHNDETTPHLHYMILPITQGKKGEKLCAKEITSREHLSMMHPAMEAYVSNELGHQVDIINGATKEGNKALKEFKAGKAKEDLEKAKAEAEKIIEEAKQKAEKIVEAEREEMNEEFQKKFDFIENTVKSIKNYPQKDLKFCEPIDGYPEGCCILPTPMVYTQFLAREIVAGALDDKKELFKAHEQLTEVKKENRKLANEVLHLKEKNNRLKKALEMADKYIDRIKRVLNRLNERIPNLEKEFVKAVKEEKAEDKNEDIPESSFKNVDINDDYERYTESR